ncbi:polysaccharide deacetylase family protein [Bacillus sp. RAR_GA_16]|uniref:polysaccharide deacetylase family protein n=1 Tax=Bacillus sp. RAR_GA_16 TaxID=2876774 RepID=UPI001CCDDF32|nr:polysaccharide deacetylase family protein [Bacillus sp. RAR_GA_16]MCA0174118.1 polysaccharide deacetylase family protein [Bacillus sp. RAR_GA_16]
MVKRLPFKRIKWPGWVVLIFLGIFIVIGIGKWVGDSSAKGVQSKSKEETSIEYNQDIDETNRYTMLINTPVIENSSLAKSIQDWITKQKETFLSEVEAEKDHLGSGYRAHLTIQVDAKKGAKDTTSLIFHSFHLVNTVSADNHFKIFTMDSTHKPLKLTEFLMPYGETAETIRSNLKQQLKQNQVIKNELNDHKLKEILQEPNSWNWMANENSLTLFIEKSKLTENHTGTIEVNIPLDKKNTGVLKQTGLNPGEKYVALTFDDGPRPEVTPRVLEALKKHHAKATFFMLGSQVEKHPSLAAQVADAGHEIGNHTDRHINLTQIEKSQLVKEVTNSSQEIEEATGQIPTLIRPPYGEINSQVEEVARSNGSSLILWSVDSLDWKSKNARAINEVVQEEVVSGSIILLHDVHPTTADALPNLLTTLEKEGYHFLTVSQLLSTQEKYRAGTYYGKS